MPSASRHAMPARVLLCAATGIGVAIALGSTPASAQTIEIRPMMSAGMELRYETSQSSRTELPEGMGTMEQYFSMVGLSRVTSLDADGSGTFETVYESARMRMVSPLGVQEWDSSVDPEPEEPAFRVFSGMVGRSVESRFGSDGRPEDIESMMEATVAAGVSDEARAMVREIGAGLQASIDGTPDFLMGPIAVGEVREMEMSVPVPFAGGVRMARRYTLDRVESREGTRVAVFSMTGSMAMGADAAVAADGAERDTRADLMSAMGVEMGGGEVTGSMTFDLDQGVLVESLETTTMSAVVMGQTMTVVMESRTRLLR